MVEDQRKGTTSKGKLPLAGVTVLDLTTFLSGPFCTQILADLGAEVLKVESLDGDSSRGIPPYFVGDDSAYFLGNNRSKRSIALNLKTPQGLEVALRLIGECDVVVENFRPGVCKRLGLDADRLREQYPGLVWASISGFGQHGPWHDRPAYDMIVQALSGVMSLTGEESGPSLRLGIPAGDLVAGMYAAIGVLAALVQHERTGKGAAIDVSMLDCQLAMLSYQGVYALFSGVDPKPQGRHHDSIPTYRSFTGADSRELVVTANTERMWTELCDELGLPELPVDARFNTSASRLDNKVELWGLLESAFRVAPAGDWVDRLNARGVPAALINSVNEALIDAGNSGRGMVVELKHPDGRAVSVLGNPIKIDGEVGIEARYPPALGEDTADVLVQLGYGASQIEAMQLSGVIRSGG
ncbi:CaiB/BaiF CoA transferase family protein [Parafrigoribacterium humi]|uniref:CaiB/BaiF CoA transferase family protein n=1 Tax=Parafrigoribacterium humi TaxID=3144664 RepID=UPI0032EBAFEB